MKDSIILATDNKGKIKELSALLASKKCIPQRDLNIESTIETGKTFIENAILKARHAAKIGNMPAIADDSGLVIPVLHGNPGIYSARFAGKNASDIENINKVTNSIKKLPNYKTNTPAYFYCAIALLKHPDDPTPYITTGELSGEIILNPQGDFGFGYDPIFYLPDYKCTLAELPLAIKNAISHRAKALLKLKDFSKGC